MLSSDITPPRMNQLSVKIYRMRNSPENESISTEDARSDSGREYFNSATYGLRRGGLKHKEISDVSNVYAQLAGDHGSKREEKE
jgi:hypothetical protein